MGGKAGGGGRSGANSGASSNTVSFEQRLAGTTNAEARSQAIRQASASEIESATQSRRLSANEASSELARRTETVNVSSLREGDVVQDGMRIAQITSASPETGLRARMLTATGEPNGGPVVIRTSTVQRYQTPETGRAYQRVLTKYLDEIGALFRG